jgi:hypothetical protein
VAIESQRPYPVSVEGELDSGLSRWLWLVKWLLAIPHYIILIFLWIAFFILTVVAFFCHSDYGAVSQRDFQLQCGSAALALAGGLLYL